MLPNGVTICVTLVLIGLTLTLITCEPGSSSFGVRSKSSSRSSSSSGSKLNCTHALFKCSRRMSCGMSLHDYRISCKPELSGKVANCSETCQLAIVSLATITEGHDYLHCDCAKSDYCRTVRNRTQSCNPKRLPKEGDHDTCRKAELFCRADQVCNASFDYYRRSCSDLIRGKTKECSKRCNNTIALLWRQKSGTPLKNCSCDKGFRSCRKEREAIMRTCLGLSDYRAGYTSSSPSTSPCNPFVFGLFTLLLSLLSMSSPCSPSTWSISSTEQRRTRQESSRTFGRKLQ
ncbi:hypothetical protein HDE_05651 [Halotydeus destructor]|nr:hypothetical protein HDE_05651 [Halotydeus destructor]